MKNILKAIIVVLAVLCSASSSFAISAITGASSVCAGLTTALSDASTGGTWSSSNGAVATVNSSTGVVTGVAAGTTIITYKISGFSKTTMTFTVDALPSAISGTASVCAGLTTTLSDAGSGTWSSASTSVATIGSGSGIVTGVVAGTATITYKIATGCMITKIATVNALPASITATATVCNGSTITLSDAGGGKWNSGTTTIATIGSTTGIVTGVAAGTANITYTLVTGCITQKTVTVNAVPAALTDTMVICATATTVLSDAVSGGTWSSGNTAVATIAASTGIMTGVAAGTSNITYSLGNGCAVAVKAATINALPGAISGTASVCAGATTTLSDAGGGTWASATTTVATIGSATAVVTGIAAGTANITYTLSTGCNIVKTTTVNAVPAAISGATVVCAGATITLTNTVSGGSWASSSTAVATAGSATGVVTGVAAGTVNITYSLGNGCSVATKTVTVNPLPSAISGTASVCLSATTTLSDAGGGNWSSANTTIVTIGSATGTVTGVAAGTANITYTLSTGCTAAKTVTVNILPSAISGVTNVCVSAAITLSDLISGGAWSSSNTSFATIGSATGTVTGVAAGTTNITYILGTGCKVVNTITVNPLPVAITGTNTVCAGLAISLSNTTSGGTWSAGNTSVALAGTTGTVTGIAAGTSGITYMLGTGCKATRAITVNPLPAVITGSNSVCAGSIITLSDAGTGTWSSDNISVASIGATNGALTGITAGTATITYMLGTGCMRAATVTVNSLPVAITGTTVVCAGLTTVLTDTTSGGTWGVDNTSIAIVDTAGVITAISAGTAGITYMLGTGCIAAGTVTVNPLPAAISGVTNVCSWDTTTLANATIGGTWVCDNTSVAMIDTTGIVTGIAAGTAGITYALSTGCIAIDTVAVNALPTSITGTFNICTGSIKTLSNATSGGIWTSCNTAIACIGSANGAITGMASGTSTVTYILTTGCMATNVVTVNAIPSVITGTTAVCPGATTALSNTASCGVWTTGNTTIVSVGAATGVVTGKIGGLASITYTLGACGTVTKIVTVNPMPVAISGDPTTCEGLTNTFSDASSGGAWSSSNAAVATIDPVTRVVAGITAGTATITYTLPTGCAISKDVTINPLPVAITGTNPICNGATVGLYEPAAGKWTSHNPAVASVNLYTGLVKGVTPGTSVITYALSTGCITTDTITVNAMPSAITGTATICAGLTTTLSDPSTGGAWSSSNTAVAIIDTNTQVVTGVSAGTANITFSYATGCMVTKKITVNPVPVAITGTDSICIGLTTMLSSATAGGRWTGNNGPVANVGVYNGIIKGVSAGTANITYTLSTGCVATQMVTVNTLPTPVIGKTSVCAGLAIMLSDSSANGMWNSGNTTIATIDSTGTVTAIAAGIANITYQYNTGCVAAKKITVNPLPATVSGTSTVCVAAIAVLSDAGGGKWTTANTTVATVGLYNGAVKGVNPGTAVITYTLATGCIITDTMTVDSIPSVITGTASVCFGLTTVLNDTTDAGTWSIGDATIASMDTTGGIITLGGLTVGTTTLTYSYNNTGCMVTRKVTVNPLPTAIFGDAVVCPLATITLSDTTTGGKWSVGNAGIATINTYSGAVTGKAAGTTTITYKLGTGCIATDTILVNPLPAAIAGNAGVCVGLTTTLSNATGGGHWSSADTTFTTLDASGVVAGVTVGTTTITYTITTGCMVKKTVTVNPLPTAIVGTPVVCAGTTIALTDTTVGNGKWSVGNTMIATVGITSGIVTGKVAGTTTITYKLGTGCIATDTVTVSPLPSVIAGTTSVCPGLTTALIDTTTAGYWSAGDTTIASIDGSGIVTGIAAGTTSITYTIATGCLAKKTITVNPLPAAISGISNVCVGSVTVLSDAGNGKWTSSNTTVATINVARIVTGIAAGSAVITYQLPTGCLATNMITVNPLPSVITGVASVCPGLTTTLTDTTANGTWSISNTAVAAVDSTGLFSGIAAGTASVTYALATGCITKKTVTVFSAPAAITGASNVCVGSMFVLSDAGGGKWSSCNTTVATVGSVSRVVTGIAAGTTTVTYTLSTGCIATGIITVNAVPNIMGITSVCAGLTTTLTDTTNTGSWNSGNTSIATIAGDGTITGVSAGTACITYTLGTGCLAKKTVTVNTVPAAISGLDNVCAGQAITLSDAGAGKWSSSDTTIAAIGSTSRIVNGIAPGTASVTYTLSTGCLATMDITVNDCGSLPTNDSSKTTAVTTLSFTGASLIAYPNPNQGNFNLVLSSPTEEPAVMTITNMIGQRILELPIVTNKPVPVTIKSVQSSGIYLVTVVTAKDHYETKVIINH